MDHFTEEEYYQEDIQGLRLENAVIEGKTFEDCNFKNVAFLNVTFKNCRFLDVSIQHSTWSVVKMVGSKCHSLSISDSKFLGVDWSGAESLQDLSFSNVKLDQSNFRLIEITRLCCKNCSAIDTDFANAILEGAIFEDTDLEEARFYETNLHKSDFRTARNYSISSQHNNIKDAAFTLPEAVSLLYGIGIKLES